MDKYLFFNKVSDFILGLVAVMIVTTIVFFKKYKTLSNINVNNYLIIGTIFYFYSNGSTTILP